MGVDEIDMVINVGYMLDRDFVAALADIKAVAAACRQPERSAILKVILECGSYPEELHDQMIIDGCMLSAIAGADFVKTSTGFNNFGGATFHDVSLMKHCVGPSLSVKASGAVRDHATAVKVIELGASRIGASAGVQIVAGQTATTDY
jgi:deoxyribose-phosphate aldolase